MKKTYKQLKEELKELKQDLKYLRQVKLQEIIDSLPNSNEIHKRKEEIYYCHHTKTIVVADDSLTAKELCNQHDNLFSQYELNGLIGNYAGIGRCNKIKTRHFIECNENGEVIGERITKRTNIYRSYYKI